MSSVSPQTVFITGANRGIGLEMVRQLTELKEPPKIIVATYRNADKAKELFNVAETSGSVRPIQLEMCDTASYTEVMERVSSVVGDVGINLLINNAAVGRRKRTEKATKDDFLEAYEVNTVAPTLLTKAFIPLLKKGSESGNGSPFTWSSATVINVSSRMGSVANTKSVENAWYPYRMSKAALNMATKLLSVELQKHGILVVSLHPGCVKTDMGGSEATLEKHESVSSIFTTLKNLTVTNNGGFISYDGKPLEY